MRLIFALCLGLFTGLTPVMVAQENAQWKPLGITLYLPPDIASETVQINYFMLGPFGGYGGYVTTEKGRVSYDIPASRDGKPAAAVKVIAYLPGCEIAKFEVAMQGAWEARTLSCKALGRIPLQGRILPVSVAQTAGMEVEINYEADWDHEFFGIADGMVTAIHVATVIPDKDGKFEVELPDFNKQTDLGRGSFQFMLRKTAGRNIVALLKPGNMLRFSTELAIRSSYAPFVLFSADTFISTPTSTDSGVVEHTRND
jgi:hypothetical protein